jgi:nucleoside-diphosphate-sugar epimerase
MNSYKQKKILITGGLGFLGSNLAVRLVNEGAAVTILDSLDDRYGGNMVNIETVKSRVKLIIGDVCNKSILKPLLADTDIVFHFAAQVSYIDSLKIPLEDLDKNALSTLMILEICRELNHKPLILFASSRMVLGYVNNKMFSENDYPKPLSLYGVHKLLSENYLHLYFREYKIPFIVMRITNPYGPHQQIKHSKYSLVGWFIRMAMNGETIRIFGEGNQLRDYIYSEDIVEGFYQIGKCEKAVGRIVNIGSGEGTAFRDMVSTVLQVVKNGNMEFVPWPNNYENLETGDAIADISLIRDLTGFSPQFSLPEGTSRTFDYYREHLAEYI